MTATLSIDVAPKPGRVLLVDDDEMIAESLRHCLLAVGCEVDAARDRGFAEELMILRRYDVVVIDPYLTGELLRKQSLLDDVRRRQPGATLVVLSTYTSPETPTGSGRRREIFLRKPQSLSHLTRLVLGALPGAAAETLASRNDQEVRT